MPATEYALILDGVELRSAILADPPPPLAPNKGAWLPADPLPPAPDGAVQITGTTGAEIDGRWVRSWVTEPLSPEQIAAAEAAAWAMLRAERADRLAAATAMLDRHRNQRDFGLSTTLTDDQATAWAVYAQALRDLPETTINPAAPDWPVAPDKE